MSKYHQGIYKPVNPEKYKGRERIIYRSGWELKVMRWLDKHPDVIKWSSEEIVIPYKNPLDNRYHRYFVDFYVKFKDGREYIIEVKPFKQTLPPSKPKNKRGTKRYLKEITEYAKNQAKWNAAKEFARKKGYNFMILTERDIT